MALSTGTKLEIASKRLDGKAYTNPGTPAASEEIASLVQLSSNAVFYDQPPQNSIVPTSPSTYTLVSASLGGKPIAEYIEFDLTSDFLNGNFPTTTATTPALLPTTDASAGSVYSYQHIFLAKLPTDYIASSNNPKKNTGFFTNGTFLTGSGFSLQLIPPSFGVLYTAKLYNGSTEIAANDPVDWNLDYSTGVVLVQDRTGTLAGSTVPTKLKAYLYIGDYTSTTISNLSSSLAALSSSVITGTGNAGTASAGFLITSSNDGLLYTQSGSNAKNSLIFRDADITTAANQPIGRIAFESLDSNTAGSNNSQAVRAFIEAVSEDAQPDAFLAFGTALSGSLPQERVRITASGSVGIGVTAPVNTLEVGLGGITTTSLTSSGDVLINGDLEVTGGDIKTTTTIGNIFNAGATTINIGGAASTVNIGHTSGTGTTTVRNNLTVDGNLTVNGTTTVINTDNLLVEDRFIILASGSIASSPQDSGIVVQTTTGSSGIGSGSALFLNGTGVLTDGTSRWGLAQNIPHNATSVTPTDYMVTVSSSTAAPSNTLPPTYGSASAGYGNMHINTTDGEIWIYV
jgi:hypothetical protein